MMLMLLLMMLQLVSKGCPKEDHSGGGYQKTKTKGRDKTKWQCVDVHSGLFTFLCVHTCFSSICYNVMLVVG